MEAIERVEIDLKIIKIAILGDANVGKTSIYNCWLHKHFSERALTPNNNTEFNSTERYLTVGKEQTKHKVIFQLWDIATNEEKRDKYNLLLGSTQIFIIVIDATTSDEVKINQINKWYDIINMIPNRNTSKVIVIQNKIDLNDAKPLEAANLTSVSNKYDAIISISCKKRINLTQIDSTFSKVLAPLIFNSKSQTTDEIKEIQIYSELSSFDEISEAINALTDAQATHLLLYTNRLLKFGTTRDVHKPYKLSFFGGGTEYVYNNTEDHVFGPEAKIHAVMPDNIALMLTDIDAEAAPAKTLLLKLYSDAIKASEKIPFGRKAITQLFYQSIFPNYLKIATQDETLELYRTISNLVPEQINAILNNLRLYLLKGTTDEPAKPYQLALIGGIKYTKGEIDISLPHHVYWMVTKIDLYLDNARVDSANSNLKAKSKELLYELYLDVILAILTANDTRAARTQLFYEHSLPNFIYEELGKFDDSVLRTKATNASYLKH